MEAYVLANACREKESITHLGDSPRLQGLFNGPGQYRPSKALKLRALESYMKTAHYLLPKNKETHKPVLWHPDLHTDNIFVDPEEPTRITGVIDWQAVHAAPIFLQVRRPALLLDFDGPIPPERLKAPRLPENFAELSADEKIEAKKLHTAQAMYVLYEIELLQQCKDAGSALRGRDTLLTRITGLVGSLFTDGEPPVLSCLIQAVDRWGEIVGWDATGDQPRVPCPIHFSEEERAQVQEDLVKWEEGVEILDDIIRRFGAYTGWDGFVDHDNYDDLKQMVLGFREVFLDRMAATEEERREWVKAWPFPVTP